MAKGCLCVSCSFEVGGWAGWERRAQKDQWTGVQISDACSGWLHGPMTSVSSSGSWDAARLRGVVSVSQSEAVRVAWMSTRRVE